MSRVGAEGDVMPRPVFHNGVNNDSHAPFVVAFNIKGNYIILWMGHSLIKPTLRVKKVLGEN